MTNRQKLWTGIAVWIGGTIALVVLVGSSGRNDTFEPQNEFKLDTWIALPGPFDINKAVVYVIAAAAITVWAMTYIAKRMHDRPIRVQTIVETL
jgi:F-type H+-transporting ATPase subunit a